MFQRYLYCYMGSVGTIKSYFDALPAVEGSFQHIDYKCHVSVQFHSFLGRIPFGWMNKHEIFIDDLHELL